MDLGGIGSKIEQNASLLGGVLGAISHPGGIEGIIDSIQNLPNIHVPNIMKLIDDLKYQATFKPTIMITIGGYIYKEAGLPHGKAIGDGSFAYLKGWLAAYILWKCTHSPSMHEKFGSSPGHSDGGNIY